MALHGLCGFDTDKFYIVDNADCYSALEESINVVKQLFEPNQTD